MNRLYYRLATSEAGLAKGYLFAQGVPPPTNTEYRDHAAKVPVSTGGEARHGYRSVTFLWDVLDARQAGVLRGIIEGAGTTIYATFAKFNGESLGTDWVDVSGKPSMPDLAPAQTITQQGVIFQNVQLRINAVTILNEPADFS